MALHAMLALEIHATYKNGVKTVTEMDEKSALFGTDDDDNPFADLEKIKREIKMLLLKIFLTSVGEDLPQFLFNVEHHMRRRKEDNNFMLANGTSCIVPTTDSCEGDGEGGSEMVYLLKSAAMVRVAAQ